MKGLCMDPGPHFPSRVSLLGRSFFTTSMFSVCAHPGTDRRRANRLPSRPGGESLLSLRSRPGSRARAKTVACTAPPHKRPPPRQHRPPADGPLDIPSCESRHPFVLWPTDGPPADQALRFAQAHATRTGGRTAGVSLVRLGEGAIRLRRRVLHLHELC